MKKNIPMTFFMGLTVIMMLFSPVSAKSRTLSEILNDGTLKIGMIAEKDYPFVFKNEKGKMNGFDVQLSHDIARELGVRPVIYRTAKTFDQLTQMLRKGEVDLVISDYTITLHRARYILYSKPYTEIPFVVLINTVWYAGNKQKGVKPLKRLNQPDVTMATIRSSALEKRLKEAFPLARAKTRAHSGELGRALLNGDVNAVFCTLLTAHFIREQHPNRRLMIREEPIPGIMDRIGIGICPNAFHLKYWIDEYIGSRHMPVSVDEILRRATQPGW